jgi:uncharacterized protein
MPSDEKPNSPKHVIVTGATGFLGKPTIQSLLAAGYTVTALVRSPLSAKQVLPSEVRLVSWDGVAIPPTELFESTNAVVHLAGETLAKWPWTQARKQILLDSRVLSTRAVVTSLHAAQKPPAVFVMASGMGYHGNAGLMPVTESGPPGTDFLGTMASAWEAAAGPAQALGIRVVALRFGMILALQGGALAPLKRVYGLGLGARLGSGKQGHPWIHRDDAIGLILHSLKHANLQGPVHGCAPQTPSQWAFAKALGRALHRPVWPWTPTWALKLILGEFSDILLHGQYGQPVKARDSGYAWKFPQLEAALQDCVSHT